MTKPMKLLDKCGRIHDYLRISLIEKCNLKCLYCMPNGFNYSKLQPQIMSPTEIFFLTHYFTRRGVCKVRLTGGEPLLRTDLSIIIELLNRLKSNSEINGSLKHIGMTTNGVTLKRNASILKSAGLDSVNISLDSLKPENVKRITGFPVFKHSLSAILSALDAGFNPVKINCVVLRNVNDDELIEFVKLTQNLPVEVRFIEYMPFADNKWNPKILVSYDEMLSIIKQVFPTLGALKNKPSDTAKVFQIPGWPGKIGFITSMTQNFCSGCTRLRLTSDGYFKTCLHSNDEVNLIDIVRRANIGTIRSNESSLENWPIQFASVYKELDKIVDDALGRKAPRHAGMEQLQWMENRSMVRIGG